MFRRVLVCTDLTPVSDSLVDCVTEMKGVGMQEVVLTFVTSAAHARTLEALTEREYDAMERQKRFLEAEGLRVRVETPAGAAAAAIDAVAEKHDASIIFIGSHSKAALQALAQGTVSGTLIHHTRRPVLLARTALLEQKKPVAVCRKMFTHVLFPTDFSKAAERALDYLGKIALEVGCPVTLLHVLVEEEKDAGATRQWKEEADYLLEAKRRRLHTLGAAEVTVEMVSGDPASEIIARTDDGVHSIVVMGGQGTGLIREVFFGSVANEVVRRTGVPVLFIPAPETPE